MTSSAVVHRTVEEIWFVLAGRGEMWRKQGEREEIVDLAPGQCLTLPLGTHFQFRASTDRGGCGRRHHHAALAGRRRSGRRVRPVACRRRLAARRRRASSCATVRPRFEGSRTSAVACPVREGNRDETRPFRCDRRNGPPTHRSGAGCRAYGDRPGSRSDSNRAAQGPDRPRRRHARPRGGRAGRGGPGCRGLRPGRQALEAQGQGLLDRHAAHRCRDAQAIRATHRRDLDLRRRRHATARRYADPSAGIRPDPAVRGGRQGGDGSPAVGQRASLDDRSRRRSFRTAGPMRLPSQGRWNHPRDGDDLACRRRPLHPLGAAGQPWVRRRPVLVY